MSQTILNIKSVITNGVAIVTLQGEADAHTTPQLKRELDKLLSQNVRYIIYDCRELTYFSSAAIGATAQTHKTLKARNGDIIFIHVSDDLKEMLRLLIARRIDILPDLKAAMKQIAAQ